MDEMNEFSIATARLNARAWGVAVGLLSGIGLFVATMFLVVRGGPVVGPHLALLSIYFRGYSVSATGAVVGFAYAFTLGFGVGWTIGTVYNRLVEPATWNPR